ncbi:hypothetical protein [Ensifer sp. ENS09]|uniref:hypothetical protein n=1 Tax=Ensifer sp. ENS09 TaxID=2769263 RepID=UPI001FF050D5|nr:hypothetical protein [Ensifer sp. ENS09]
MRDALEQEIAGFERNLRAIPHRDDYAQRLMTTPGVGVLVALTFVAAIDARSDSAHHARWRRTSD